MSETRIIHITTEYITLGQFLKFAGIVDEGWEAKPFLEKPEILVDGETENRRGKDRDTSSHDADASKAA